MGPSVGAKGSPAKAASGIASDGEDVFATPHDLCCPITHELFREPVVTSAGQVYERAAIAEQLKRSAVDPLTQLPLHSGHLTPVFPIRCRALEYRERTSRCCVERALWLDTPDPVSYLRRAAELTLGTDVRVPGLTQEFSRFLTAHQSKAYDLIALKYFADELKKAGHLDDAANTYCRLLQACEDKVQQAETVKDCLCCWAGGEGSEPGAKAAAKLAHFMEIQTAFTPSQIIDLMQEAKIKKGFITEICTVLMERSIKGTDWRRHGAILERFVCLCLSDVNEQLQELRVHCDTKLSNEAKALSTKISWQLAAPSGSEGRRRRRSKFKSLVTVGLVMSTSLFGGAGVWRVGQMLAMLYLLKDGNWS